MDTAFCYLKVAKALAKSQENSPEVKLPPFFFFSLKYVLISSAVLGFCSFCTHQLNFKHHLIDCYG